MCGITGAVWDSAEYALDEAVLGRMTEVLRHRGPDGGGAYIDRLEGGRGAALGHRRLSIIDVAGGKQPLANEDGGVWITFNGEIYNYRELRAELEAKGHRFRTNSDTETIVHLYEEFGRDCLRRLRGMFAFAIWDRRRRRLLLARDRLGQKPLVYREDAGRLLFASEIKSILQAPATPREADPVALEEYLTYGYVPHPRTMFAGIRKLPPAHYAIYENQKLTVARYWSPDCERESSASLAELRERLAHELNEAVRLRLRSDVPLGAFLSGGIDSTTIVGLMQRHLKRPAKTYTIGFEASRYDESPFARAAAEHLGTEHRQMLVRPDSAGILSKLAWHFDEPFADSSAIPTYYVAQMTSRHVKVALTGDGGDELFAGYPRYQTINRLGAFDRLPGPLRGLIANRLWSLPSLGGGQTSRLAKLRFRMNILRQPPERRYVNWVGCFLDGARRELLSDDLRETLGASDPARVVAQIIQASGRRAAGGRAMHADLMTYLPGDLLAKVDITSMAHGLECRSPFLDHRVVELAAAIPYHYLARGKHPKPLLTETFADFFPPALAKRPKMGFSIPLDRWLRDELRPLVHDLLLDQTCLSRGYFRPRAIRDLVERHESGRWNHGGLLWALLCLETWHRAFIDPATAPSSSREDFFENGGAIQEADHAAAGLDGSRD